MGNEANVQARKALRPRLLRAVAGALLLATVLGIGLLVAVHRTTRPWPTRVPVRLEPLRPFLADADVTPDNPFFYLRQLADASALLQNWRPPSATNAVQTEAGFGAAPC